MTKLACHGLLLSCLLTGCTAVPLAPGPGPEFVPDLKTNTIAATVLPPANPIPAKAQAPAWPRQSSPFDNAQAQATGSTSGGAAGASGEGASTAVGFHLRLAQTEPATLKLIPMLDDANQLQSVTARPAEGTLSWSVQAVGGDAGIAKVRVVLRREANRPAPPPLFVDGQPTPAPASPEPGQGEPATLELDAKALGVPAEARSGTSFTIKLGLTGAEGAAFLKANANASKASVRVTLVDAAGQAVPGPNGQPLTLQANLTIL